MNIQLEQVTAWSVFFVSNVLQGQFELVINPGVAITSFTQPQITAGEVQFIHDGGEIAPSFNDSAGSRFRFYSHGIEYYA